MKPAPSILWLLLVCGAACHLNAADDPAVDFLRQIKPVIADRCIECHNSENLLGNLNLQSRALAMQKRKEGPVIVPKVPAGRRGKMGRSLRG